MTPANNRTRGIFERPKGSGIWWVRYFDQHGREYREKVGPKALAKDVYTKRRNEIAEQRFFPERIRRRAVTLATAIDDCLSRSKTLRAFKEYERAARNWKNAFGGRTLSQITPGDLDRYRVKRLDGGASAATFNRELSFLRRVFNLAIADGKVDTSPIRRVKFMKENPAPEGYPTEAEEARLAAELGPEEWAIVRVALCTGLRQSEQFQLRWEHVDFRSGFLTVPLSKHGQFRRVRMNETVIGILEKLPSRHASPWVFPSKKGTTHRNPTNFVGRIFRPALERADIRNFRWHDLRHTFASRLVEKGVPLPAVKELMGHQTIAMTLRYSHLSPEHLLHAVQSLNNDRTGTATGTSRRTRRQHPKVPSQLLGATAEKRAGGRGRTGDVQLGKLSRPLRGKGFSAAVAETG